ncbi:MAG: hypothetical protein P8178_07135 [Candidatus Thiodiazotropha sp.]
MLIGIVTGSPAPLVAGGFSALPGIRGDTPPLTTVQVNWAASAVPAPMTMWFAPLDVKLAYRLDLIVEASARCFTV